MKNDFERLSDAVDKFQRAHERVVAEAEKIAASVSGLMGSSRTKSKSGKPIKKHHLVGNNWKRKPIEIRLRNTGEIFPSITETARRTKTPLAKVRESIKEQRKVCGGLQFEKIEKPE